MSALCIYSQRNDTEHFRKRIKKYGVIIQNLHSEKKYLEIKKIADTFFTFLLFMYSQGN